MPELLLPDVLEAVLPFVSSEQAAATTKADKPTPQSPYMRRMAFFVLPILNRSAQLCAN